MTNGSQPTSTGMVGRQEDSGAADFRSGFCTLVGRPNVGKSSLCNRLVGERVAITSPTPQTTRNRIAAVMHLPGAQIVFLDTPGIHKPKHRLGQTMVAIAAAALQGVEVACLVVDASVPPSEADRRAAWHVAGARCAAVLVGNKVDLVPEGGLAAALLPYVALLSGRARVAAVVPVSAETGFGMHELVQAIVAHLPDGPRYFPDDAVTDQPEQALVAELVREQALHRLREEVPHAVAVTVDEWRPRESGLLYIGVTLYVERQSQKGIVIGAGGAMLRAIGAAARREVEHRLSTPVYLDVWVKVREGWRDRPGALQPELQ